MSHNCFMGSKSNEVYILNLSISNIIIKSHNIYCLNLMFCYSFDRFLLAVIWTLGLLSCNQTDDKDIKYVAKQIERKKAWIYYSEEITVSPLS